METTHSLPNPEQNDLFATIQNEAWYADMDGNNRLQLAAYLDIADRFAAGRIVTDEELMAIVDQSLEQAKNLGLLSGLEEALAFIRVPGHGAVDEANEMRVEILQPDGNTTQGSLHDADHGTEKELPYTPATREELIAVPDAYTLFKNAMNRELQDLGIRFAALTSEQQTEFVTELNNFFANFSSFMSEELQVAQYIRQLDEPETTNFVQLTSGLSAPDIGNLRTQVSKNIQTEIKDLAETIRHAAYETRVSSTDDVPAAPLLMGWRSRQESQSKKKFQQRAHETLGQYEGPKDINGLHAYVRESVEGYVSKVLQDAGEAVYGRDATAAKDISEQRIAWPFQRVRDATSVGITMMLYEKSSSNVCKLIDQLVMGTDRTYDRDRIKRAMTDNNFANVTKEVEARFGLLGVPKFKTVITPTAEPVKPLEMEERYAVLRSNKFLSNKAIGDDKRFLRELFTPESSTPGAGRLAAIIRERLEADGGRFYLSDQLPKAH